MGIVRHIIIVTGCWLLLASCGRQKPVAALTRHKNIIVVTDLGKRLGLYNQAGRDKALITAVFDAFEKNIRSHLYIHAKDKLHIIVAPNNSLQPQLADWQNRLVIDLERVAVKDRVNYLKKCRPAFFSGLDSLYAAAVAGSGAKSSDIWQFFNGQLNSYLQTDTLYDNYVVVLSDGYSNGNAAGAEYTGSATLLDDARSSENWQRFVALHPLKKVPFTATRLHFFFAELQADSAMEIFPDELKLLQELWAGWARMCNPGGQNKTLPRITEANVQSEIAAFIAAVALPQPSGSLPVTSPERPPVAVTVEQPVIKRPAAPVARPTPEPPAVTPAKTTAAKPDKPKPATGEGFSIRQDF